MLVTPPGSQRRGKLGQRYLRRKGRGEENDLVVLRYVDLRGGGDIPRLNTVGDPIHVQSTAFRALVPGRL